MSRTMNQQTVINTLRDALNDSKAIERKLNTLIRDQRIDAYTLSIALTRLENFRDDIRTAIDDVANVTR